MKESFNLDIFIKEVLNGQQLAIGVRYLVGVFDKVKKFLNSEDLIMYMLISLLYDYKFIVCCFSYFLFKSFNLDFQLKLDFFGVYVVDFLNLN